MTWKKAIAWVWLALCASCVLECLWFAWPIVWRVLLGVVGVVALSLVYILGVQLCEWSWEQITSNRREGM